MSRISSQYVVSGIKPIQGGLGVIIPGIAPNATSAQPNTDSSKPTSRLSNFGVVSLAPDIKVESKINLGDLYSNGYRYKYLAFQATTDDCNTSGIVTAYVDPTGIPQNPPNDTPTQIMPPIKKVPYIPKNNC